MANPINASILNAASDPAHVLESCGEKPGSICRFVAERSSSVGLAKAVDWLAHKPLRILLVIIGAWILNWIVRRVIRRISRRIEGSEESGHLQRLRARAPGVLMHTGGVIMRAAARAQSVALVLCSGHSVF